jgi:hypothetical protein
MCNHCYILRRGDDAFWLLPLHKFSGDRLTGTEGVERTVGCLQSTVACILLSHRRHLSGVVLDRLIHVQI